MSRIDEALRRVSTGPTDQRGPRAISERPLHRPDGSVLEIYPAEERAVSFESELPGPAPSPSRRHLEVPTEWLLEGRPQVFQTKLDSKLLISPGNDPLLLEQYRRLAAAVHELQVDRGLKTMMVTSALPREGKTLTVTNLALTLSGSYRRRVLLIDADLRRPSVHGVLKIANAKGLHEVLNSDLSALPTVHVSPLLSVLTAGGPSDSPLAALTSDRMRALLEHAAANFDWVLLDAPPVGLMPDAALLAGITGASLLVIAAGMTPYKLVERAIAELGRERIVGTVLNRIEDPDIASTRDYQAYYVNSASH
jgi:capsular exopolysaccharide synthesis family protein